MIICAAMITAAENAALTVVVMQLATVVPIPIKN